MAKTTTAARCSIATNEGATDGQTEASNPAS